jgi:recombination protein RecT
MANELIINPKTIGTELLKFKTQMEAALPKHMTAERMARIALTQLRVNPKLMLCTQQSFYGSLMAASQLGLEPGVNGQCYLIPYGTTCTLVPGWRGYMDLVGRTERAAAWTDAVYDGDEFDYEKGDKPFIHHKPGKWAGKEAALIFTYAVGRTKSSEWPVIEVWDIDKVWAHRNKQNKVGDRHYSYAHPEMYARKIPLLQVIKYLPSSIELNNASALDVTASEGRQNLTIDMVLDKNSPGLESGGDASAFDVNDPDEQELETLFDKLGKNPTERKMLRESYIPQGRRKELVEYLQGRLAPAGQAVNVSTKPAEQATEQASKTEASTEQAKTDAPQDEPRRGRGRPKKIDSAPEEKPDTQPETQTQETKPAQEEKPAQHEEPTTKQETGKFQF